MAHIQLFRLSGLHIAETPQSQIELIIGWDFSDIFLVQMQLKISEIYRSVNA